MVNYELLPEHMREPARLYIEEKIAPGAFLTAVICNDLTSTFRCADDTNFPRIVDFVRFFYWEAPSNCWGSREAMREWILKADKSTANEPEPLDAESVAARDEYAKRQIIDAGRGELVR